ncbi:MAG TPA: PilZ domain-containing protein [Gemmataceae bacterium]|nr:PilZ domain-containing protein [Gemmataceae bacterium]
MPRRTIHPEEEPALAPAVERRASPRYRILQRCFVRPEGATGAEAWRCIVFNISTIGIGVTVPCPLQPGTILEIMPHRLPGTRPLQARVVRSDSVEYLWFCGCELLHPLSEEELRTWLAYPSAPRPAG